MQEVQIIRWCDFCLKDEGVKVPGLSRSIPVAVDDLQAELDLCEECYKLKLQPLRDLLGAVHSRASRPAATEAGEEGNKGTMTQCPLDGVWMSIRSRVSHARNKHAEMKPGEIDWRFGDDVTETWACGCGLTFPSLRSREAHCRRKDIEECSQPLTASASQPLRPV